MGKKWRVLEHNQISPKEITIYRCQAVTFKQRIIIETISWSYNEKSHINTSTFHNIPLVVFMSSLLEDYYRLYIDSFLFKLSLFLKPSFVISFYSLFSCLSRPLIMNDSSITYCLLLERLLLCSSWVVIYD